MAIESTLQTAIYMPILLNKPSEDQLTSRQILIDQLGKNSCGKSYEAGYQLEVNFQKTSWTAMLLSPPGRREQLLDTPQGESHCICGSSSFMNLNRELPIIIIIRYCIAKHCIVVPCGHWDISVQVTEKRQAEVTRITSRMEVIFRWTTSECYLRNGAEDTVAKNST